MQPDSKTGVECALDHALTMYLQDARCCKAPHQCFAHFGRIGARFAGEQQRLAHRSNVESDDDLIGDLAGLSIAISAHQRDVFARGIGEYGSVIFIAGNLPMKTEIAPLMIMSKLDQFDYAGASAVALVLLCISFSMLLLLNAVQEWQQKEYNS